MVVVLRRFGEVRRIRAPGGGRRCRRSTNANPAKRPSPRELSNSCRARDGPGRRTVQATSIDGRGFATEPATSLEVNRPARNVCRLVVAGVLILNLQCTRVT